MTMSFQGKGCHFLFASNYKFAFKDFIICITNTLDPQFGKTPPKVEEKKQFYKRKKNTIQTIRFMISKVLQQQGHK